MAKAKTKKQAAPALDPDLSLDGLDLDGFEEETEEEGEVEGDEEWDEDSDGEGDEDEGLDDDEALEDEDTPTVKRVPRTRAPRITEADKDAAAAEGVAAFERGEPLESAPPMHEDLLREWRYGWGFANVATNQGHGIPLYSRIPLAFHDPAQIRLFSRERDRKERESRTFRDDPGELLPWTMDQLSGTTWANIWTCHIETIGGVMADRWGQAVPTWERPEYPFSKTPGHRHSPTFCIGHWYSGFYSIEHWIRLDVLTPAEQLVWYAGRVARLRDDIAQHRDSAQEIKENWERTSMPGTNYRLQIEGVKSHQRDLSIALQAMHAFAKQHGLYVSPDHINGTLWRDYKPRTGAAEQLSLI